MRTPPLTDRTLRSLKPPATGRRDHYDGAVPGLHVRLFASGARSWRWIYRPAGSTTQKVLTWRGVLPLVAARQLAREAAVAVARGQDPAGRREAQRAAAKQAGIPLTVNALVDDFLTVYPVAQKLAPTTTREWTRIFERELRPDLGTRPAAEVTKKDLTAILDGILARGAGPMANRTATAMKTFFAWALDKEQIGASPAATLRAVAKEEPRARVLDDTELRALWPHLSAYGQLQLLTCARGGELEQLRWSSVDLENRWITFQAPTVKTRETRLVPLAAPALALVQGLQATAGGTAVFPSPRNLDVGLTRARRYVAESLEAAGIVGATPHDLRRTGATGLARVGTERVVIKLILGHSERADVTAIYDRYARMPERRAALEKWATLLLGIVGAAARPSNVLPLTARA